MGRWARDPDRLFDPKFPAWHWPHAGGGLDRRRRRPRSPSSDGPGGELGLASECQAQLVGRDMGTVGLGPERDRQTGLGGRVSRLSAEQCRAARRRRELRAQSADARRRALYRRFETLLSPGREPNRWRTVGGALWLGGSR